MKKHTTLFAALVLISPHHHAALNVAGDYDFSSNATPTGFTEFGDPAYADGKVTLDGDGDYLQIASPLGASTNDNFVLEVIANGTGFGSFNFAASVTPSVGNGGYGVLAQGGNWGALTSGSAFVGTAPHDPAPTGMVSLAYVMEAGNASLYVNGVQSDGGAGDTFTLADPALLNIGANAFDAANNLGFFIGEIDRVRISTFTGPFDPSDLLGPTDGTAPLDQPFLVNPSSSLLTDSTAEVSTDLTGSDANVTLYWADTDYGDNLTDWETNGNTVPFGLQTNGSSIVSSSDLTGLTEDTRYYFRFRAVNTVPDPDLVAWSSGGLFVATPILTKTVTDLAANALDDKQITLTWSDAFNTETQYFLERSDNNGMSWTPLPALPESTVTFTDTNLTAETTYSYRLLGSSPTDDSGYSNVVTATTTAAPEFTPTVIANYTFDDNTAPAGATEFGDPTYANGQLILDGDGDYLQIPAPATPTDNFVLEAIASAQGFGVFNFAASLSNASGTNSGYGVLAQNGNWNALTSNVGFAGSTQHGLTPTPFVAIAYVRENGNTSLYVDGFAWDSGGSDGAPQINDSGVITIGGHAFDAPNGLFNGTIDQVRLSTFVGAFEPSFLLSATGTPGSYASWIAGFNVGSETGINDDPDLDGIPNGVENFYGTDPSTASQGIASTSSNGSNSSFTHSQNETPANDLTASYQWSPDLINWYRSGDTNNGITVDFTPNPNTPESGITTVSVFASGAVTTPLFFRIGVTQAP